MQALHPQRGLTLIEAAVVVAIVAALLIRQLGGSLALESEPITILLQTCAYRELLLTTPNLNQHISGAILFDETIRNLREVSPLASSSRACAMRTARLSMSNPHRFWLQ